jgi:uncharacterized protein (TIGR02118 family)
VIQLTALYGHPQDPAAFDSYYHEKHAPLALALPGLQGYFANKPAALDPQARSPYYLIAELYFESAQAFQAALQSPAGQAAAGDTANFATGGITLVAGEVSVFKPVSIS